MRIERCVAAAMRQCYNATMRHVITCDNGGNGYCSATMRIMTGELVTNLPP